MEHINLNNEWKYSKAFCSEMTAPDYDDSGMEPVRLPHTNVITPYHYFDDRIYQFISGYRRKLEVKKEWREKQVLLTFEGIAHIASVYVNGTKVTTHLGGYTAFTVDIGPYLNFPAQEQNSTKQDQDCSVQDQNRVEQNQDSTKQDQELQKADITDAPVNILAVEVDSRESNNLPPFGNVIDYMTYGGIYREAYLEIKEPVSIEDVFVIAKADHRVKLRVAIHGYQPEQTLGLKLTLTDTSDRLIHSEIVEVRAAEIDHSFAAEGVSDWDTDHPQLYYLTAELFSASGRGSKLDESRIRFGFRTCEFKADGFYLNQKKIKLIGLNRHQCYPYVGYAMPKRMQQQDADILKSELRVNAVRTSHYPQSRHFLERCDELGLLVFTEIPGWQHIGDEAWKAIALNQVREMIVQYRNYPSVILWGVRINESQDDDEFYHKTNRLAHELDPSRQTGGVRYLKKSNLLEDVYTYNDFLHNGMTKGLDRKEDVTSDPKAPYLISEFNGHMFPTKAFDTEKRRLEHALRHVNVLDSAFAQEGISGAFGWCMFDYNTHKDFGSGDRICYHGVMDMFRNPKLAASVYASQKEGEAICEVSSSLDIGDHPAGDIGDVFVFTNADSIRLYKNDTFVKEFCPDHVRYPNLPHPPVVVDDFIGDLLEINEHYSRKTAEAMKKLLYAVKKFGPNHLPIKYKLGMAYLMLKEHLKMEDAANLYYKYIGGWGGAVTTFRFEAIKDGKVVKIIDKKPASGIRLKFSVTSEVLQDSDTYDVSAIRICAVDDSGNQLPYYQEPIKLEAIGAVELIGPEIISFKGGMAGTYVRTKGIKGEGILKLSQQDLGTTKLIFTVV